MAVALLMIFGLTTLMGASALVGLWWAAKSGQFRDMRNGAVSIFDEGEPVGEPTDMVFKTKAERRAERERQRKETKKTWPDEELPKQ